MQWSSDLGSLANQMLDLYVLAQQGGSSQFTWALDACR
jgi:hypothetical protein